MKTLKYIFFTIFLCVISFNISCCQENDNQLPKNLYSINKKKIRFIINPKSGTKNKEKIEKLIHQYIDKSKFDYKILYTKEPHHATILSKQAADLGYDMVIAIGGDGTINEVGKGLINSDTAMGIIPTGSGNGLARNLNIPIDPLKNIDLINKSQTTFIDTCQINNDVFLGIAGIGFDAHIALKFANSKTRGLWSYIYLVFKEYHKYKPQTYELIIDDKKIIKDALLISFAKSSQYGNNIKIAPKAKLNDGYLQVVILKNPPFYKISSILFRLKNGSIDKSKYYEVFSCKKVVIKQNNLIAHIDGEPAYFENGINIKVNPNSLKILISSDS
jgi:diacylglycerol kinase (ATP)